MSRPDFDSADGADQAANFPPALPPVGVSRLPVVQSLPHRMLPPRLAATAGAFSHDGRRLLIADSDGQAGVWEPERDAPLAEWRVGAKAVRFAEFSADDELVVTLSGEGRIGVWPADGGEATERYAGQTVRCAAVDPAGRRVAGGCSDGLVRIWNLASGEWFALPAQHAASVMVLTWSADARQLAAVDQAGTLGVWTIAKDPPQGWAVCAVRQVHAQAVPALEFTPGGIVTISADGTAKLWSLEKQTLLRTLPRAEPLNCGQLNCLLLAGQQRIVVAGTAGNPILVDLDLGRREHAFEAPGAGGPGTRARAWNDLRLLPDAPVLVGAGSDGLVICWDVTTGRPLVVLQGQETSVLRLAVSPVGSWIASLGKDGRVCLHRVRFAADFVQDLPPVGANPEAASE